MYLDNINKFPSQLSVLCQFKFFGVKYFAYETGRA